MKLSETEQKIVARLRKEEESLARCRWFTLLGGVVCLAAAGYGSLILFRCFQNPDMTSVVLAAYLLLPLYIALSYGVAAIGHTWRDRNGNPERRLLLRLIDELQKHDA
jgi:hypothetical protein